MSSFNVVLYRFLLMKYQLISKHLWVVRSICLPPMRPSDFCSHIFRTVLRSASSIVDNRSIDTHIKKTLLSIFIHSILSFHLHRPAGSRYNLFVSALVHIYLIYREKMFALTNRRCVQSFYIFVHYCFI